MMVHRIFRSLNDICHRQIQHQIYNIHLSILCSLRKRGWYKFYILERMLQW
jgi:hypothetical protein